MGPSAGQTLGTLDQLLDPDRLCGGARAGPGGGRHEATLTHWGSRGERGWAGGRAPEGTCERGWAQGRSCAAPWGTDGPGGEGGLAEERGWRGGRRKWVQTRRVCCAQVHMGPPPVCSETLLAWGRDPGPSPPGTRALLSAGLRQQGPVVAEPLGSRSVPNVSRVY